MFLKNPKEVFFMFTYLYQGVGLFNKTLHFSLGGASIYGIVKGYFFFLRKKFRIREKDEIDDL